MAAALPRALAALLLVRAAAPAPLTSANIGAPLAADTYTLPSHALATVQLTGAAGGLVGGRCGLLS